MITIEMMLISRFTMDSVMDACSERFTSRTPVQSLDIFYQLILVFHRMYVYFVMSGICQRIIITLPESFSCLFMALEVVFGEFLPGFIRGDVIAGSYQICSLPDLLADGVNGRLIQILLEENSDPHIAFHVSHQIGKIHYQSEKQSEKKNAGAHSDNGSQRKHLISADVLNTLSCAVSDRTNPQRRHLLFRR